jgi:predicted Rossmann fold nucleotide-binding protein DprA/Smf involved in DNA uptake
MSRLDILKASLEKKQAKFDRKLNEHFADVKSSNGQPLNDKRDGYSTMKRWDRQNDTLSKIQKEIEKTQTAIEREESRIRCIDCNRSSMPEEIQELINDGTLKQWGKYPHIMFVEGVDKARIIWDDKKGIVMHKFVSSITEYRTEKEVCPGV